MKVGKAIYNILSQSKEVQSNFPFNTTDYSPTGTELVTNGDFSAGVEQLTQPIDLTVDFVTAPGGGVIIDADSFSTDGTPSTEGIRNKTGTLNLVDGNSYKLVIEGNTTSSGFTVGNITASGNEYGTGFGTHYFVAIGNTLWIRQQTAGTTNLTTFTIEELGGDWTDSGTPLKAATFDANGLKITSVNGNGNENRVSQASVTEDDKFYKVTYTINSVTLSGSNAFQYYNGEDYVTFSEQDAGTHTFYYTRQGVNNNFFLRISTNDGSTTDFVTISSISVQEMAVNKIFPELAPTGIEVPYIVYSVVSNSPSETKNTNGDIDTASIEVYGFQDTYNKAVDLGVSVRAALDRKTGTYNTIEIQSTNYVNEQMDVNEARKLWAAIQDYSIRIKNL